MFFHLNLIDVCVLETQCFRYDYIYIYLREGGNKTLGKSRKTIRIHRNSGSDSMNQTWRLLPLGCHGAPGWCWRNLHETCNCQKWPDRSGHPWNRGKSDNDLHYLQSEWQHVSCLVIWGYLRFVQLNSRDSSISQSVTIRDLGTWARRTMPRSSYILPLILHMLYKRKAPSWAI